MIKAEELDGKSLEQKWEVLTEFATCPYTLRPFVGSRLLDHDKPEDDKRATSMLVELAPGVSRNTVAHLNRALASFLDLPSEGVWIEAHAAKARRIEITLIEEEN